MTSDATKFIACPTSGSEPGSASSENPPVIMTPRERIIGVTWRQFYLVQSHKPDDWAMMTPERMTMRREVLMSTLELSCRVLTKRKGLYLVFSSHVSTEVDNRTPRGFVSCLWGLIAVLLGRGRRDTYVRRREKKASSAFGNNLSAESSARSLPPETSCAVRMP